MSVRKAIAALASGLFFAIASFAPAFAQVQNDHLIVPGQRVGPIRLGMGMDEVLATLGKPAWSYINPGDYLKIDTEMNYPSLDLEIRFTAGATPTVKSITVTAYTKSSMLMNRVTWSDIRHFNNVFHTAQGFGLGSSSFEVARAYGSYDSNSTRAVGNNMNYKNLGLYFLSTQDFRIYSISISSP